MTTVDLSWKLRAQKAEAENEALRTALRALVLSSIQGETDECRICGAELGNSVHSDDCPILTAESTLAATAQEVKNV